MRQGYCPIIFAYMRACGAPSNYYSKYLTELTPMHLRRVRKPRAVVEFTPTTTHPAQLPWVTPNHIVLATRYLQRTTTTHVCQRNVDVAYQRLLDSHTKLTQEGAKRKLRHEQAKLLAALTREWDDAEDAAQKAELKPVHHCPIELADERAARKYEKQKIASERMARKYHARKMAMAKVEWVQLKEQYRDARQDYLVARAGYQQRTNSLNRARAALRAERENYRAKAPQHVVQAWQQARDVYRHALKNRNKVRAEWKACKAKLYRLNKSSLA